MVRGGADDCGATSRGEVCAEGGAGRCRSAAFVGAGSTVDERPGSGACGRRVSAGAAGDDVAGDAGGGLEGGD